MGAGGGGGGKGGSAPSPGQFNSSASAQSYLNSPEFKNINPMVQDSIRSQVMGASGFANAATPTQTNAFGATSQWGQNPDGTWRQSQSFGGPLGDAVKGISGQLASAWGRPLDNGAQARQGAENAIYGRETSRLDPRFQQGEEQLTTQLANQGLAPGSEAYNNAMGNFQRSKNDAYQQAQYGAVMGGGQEASRQQQMDLASRFAPEQALGGLAGLTGQSQNPLLPAAMAQYQGGLQKYGMDQAGKNSTLNGILGMGGTIGGAYAGKP